MIRGYRVWDNQEKTYSDKAFSIDQLGICYVQDEDGYWEEIDDSRFIVEFETGLTDKNADMIWEGDICRLAYYTKKDGKKRWHKDFEDIEAVEFEDGYFRFVTKGQYGIGSELSFSDYGEWSTGDENYKYEAVAIGNIHENKEWLGGEE